MMKLATLALLFASAAAEDALNANNAAVGSGGISGGGGAADEDVVQEFLPPKMSFSAKDYFAAKSADAGEPLLLLFDNGNYFHTSLPVLIASGMSNKSLVPRSHHVSLCLIRIAKKEYTIFQPGTSSKQTTPEQMRSYLQSNGSCSQDPKKLIEKYDALTTNEGTKQFGIELWKYCALYNEGGVYLDSEVNLLVGLEDVLGTSGNYAVMTTSRNSGVEPYWNVEDIALPVVQSASFESVLEEVEGGDAVNGGQSILTSPMLAISGKQNEVPRKMLHLILEASVRQLEEEALLLPKALMRFVKEEEGWKFFKQRCHGVEIAGGEERR